MLEELFQNLSQLIDSNSKSIEIRHLFYHNPELVNYAVDKNETNLLSRAVVNGNLSLVQLLLEHNFLIEPKGDLTNLNTPLILSLKHRHNDIAVLLIQKGASVHYTYQQRHLLQIAIDCQCVEVIEALLKRPEININDAVDEHNNTLLHKMALSNYSSDIINVLLRANRVQLNAVNNVLETPLYLSVMNKNYRMASLLVEHGADPYFTANSTHSPIRVAVDNNDRQFLDIFLRRNNPDNFFETKLYDLMLTKQLGPFATAIHNYHVFLSQQFSQIIYLICMKNKLVEMARILYEKKFSALASSEFFSDDVMALPSVSQVGFFATDIRVDGDKVTSSECSSLATMHV